MQLAERAVAACGGAIRVHLRGRRSASTWSRRVATATRHASRSPTSEWPQLRARFERWLDDDELHDGIRPSAAATVGDAEGAFRARCDGSHDLARRDGGFLRLSTAPCAARRRRALRRPDRRRRPLRRRRRLPPHGRSAPARRSRSSRRATRWAARGTCSATRASAPTRTCSRSATRFRPWEEAKAIADGPAIRKYIHETARRVRHRRQDPLRPPRRPRRVVERGGALDGDAERTDTGETVQLTCSFLFPCTGYYHYTEPYSPDFEGTERFGGRDHPPAALARGPRLRRQARGRDRQRRHRGDDRARDGGARRARDDAAALAQLHRRRCPPRTRSPSSPSACSRSGSRTRSCAGRTRC